jgi:hypothetical protein
VLPEQAGDPGPGAGRDVRPPVEHLGHGRYRHPGVGRDIDQGATAGVANHGDSFSKNHFGRYRSITVLAVSLMIDNIAIDLPYGCA